jgi:hypothetical protein
MVVDALGVKRGYLGFKVNPAEISPSKKGEKNELCGELAAFMGREYLSHGNAASIYENTSRLSEAKTNGQPRLFDGIDREGVAMERTNRCDPLPIGSNCYDPRSDQATSYTLRLVSGITSSSQAIQVVRPDN